MQYDSGTPDDMQKFYTQFVLPSDLVFDIGANVGDRAEMFSRLAKQVIAVEPQKICLEGLESYYAGLWKRFIETNVIVVPEAVGSTAGSMTLYRNPAMTTTASFSPRYIRDTQAAGRFENRWEGSEEVKMTTLDNLIEKFGLPAFIKIDVEGFEPEVIRGLSQPVRALSFEFTPELLYMAKEVLDHAATLGPCTVNYALGNHFVKLERGEWTTPEILLEELKKFAGDPITMGDIYVRWEV